MYGGGDPLAAITTYGSRIWHVHFKDCDPAIARRARAGAWDYHAAVGRGLFCELGRGMVPFADVGDALRLQNYAGWIVVEQDVLPGLGTPAASARRNREYLHGLGL
jgi:inosose dehydratase